MLLIRFADLTRDTVWIHQLWSSTLDSRWTLSPKALRRQLASCICLVAEWDDAPVGFCAGTYQGPDPAGFTALLVDVKHRKRGIGSDLVFALEAQLRNRGAHTLRLACGASSTYFWPGLPASDLLIGDFFAKRGWVAEESVFDLVADLNGIEPETLPDSEYYCELARAGTRRSIEEFEALHFPAWAGLFRIKLAENLFNEVLVAYAADGRVAGSVLLEKSSSISWKISLGPECTALSALGVAADHRRRGVGQALVAYAFSIARKHRSIRCYINWTGLTDWYARLGAKPWAEYKPGEKLLV